jgi:hypothetical protein
MLYHQYSQQILKPAHHKISLSHLNFGQYSRRDSKGTNIPQPIKGWMKRALSSSLLFAHSAKVYDQLRLQ